MKPTIAIMSPGDMGHAVAAVLRQGGLRVISQLDGRSQRTRALAERAGIEEVADDDHPGARSRDRPVDPGAGASDRARRADRPARSLRVARGRSTSTATRSRQQTTRQIAEIIEGAGARFVDAGIIGPPPKPGASSTRFYASGRDAAAFARLGDFGLDVRVVGDQPGQASALKMCYAALTKGTTALMTQLSVAAARLGVSEALSAEFAAEPAGDARAHAARGAGDGAQGAPLGRRDGGDRKDVRGLRPHSAHVPGRGRALRAGRRAATSAAGRLRNGAGTANPSTMVVSELARSGSKDH